MNNKIWGGNFFKFTISCYTDYTNAHISATLLGRYVGYKFHFKIHLHFREIFFFIIFI